MSQFDDTDSRILSLQDQARYDTQKVNEVAVKKEAREIDVLYPGTSQAFRDWFHSSGINIRNKKVAREAWSAAINSSISLSHKYEGAMLYSELIKEL